MVPTATDQEKHPYACGDSNACAGRKPRRVAAVATREPLVEPPRREPPPWSARRGNTLQPLPAGHEPRYRREREGFWEAREVGESVQPRLSLPVHRAPQASLHKVLAGVRGWGLMSAERCRWHPARRAPRGVEPRSKVEREGSHAAAELRLRRER